MKRIKHILAVVSTAASIVVLVSTAPAYAATYTASKTCKTIFGALPNYHNTYVTWESGANVSRVKNVYYHSTYGSIVKLQVITNGAVAMSYTKNGSQNSNVTFNSPWYPLSSNNYVRATFTNFILGGGSSTCNVDVFD